MKIGIITFHCADNYGAVLQAFSLYRKTKELYSDGEVYIVNYCPESIVKHYRLIKLTRVRAFISSIVQLPFSIKKKVSFNKFRKRNIQLLDVKEISCLDYLICGSDQIWNPRLTDGVDSHYFGSIEGFKGKVVAYAASDGGYLNDVEVEIFRKYLENISVLSVRESTMIPFLKQYKQDISVVLDPVFLNDKKFWEQFASKRKYQKYILIYCLEENANILQDAYEVAKQKGCKVIELTYGFPLKRILKINHTIIPDASIPDFLSYILYADYVFTNSFHGTAFSIIFNKSFFTYNLRSKLNDRMTDLLNRVGLLDRYGISFDNGTLEKMDYFSVNDRVDQLRLDAMTYLNRSIITLL
jgi:hypothetical protein